MKTKSVVMAVLIIILVIGAVACAKSSITPTSPSAQTPTPTVTSSPTPPTSVQTPTPTVTSSPIPPTSVQTPTPTVTSSPIPPTSVQTPTPTVTSSPTPPTSEVEATEFMGKKLTPISQQRNNALAGTQVIDRETYELVIDGLVERPLSLSYDDLLAYTQVSKLMDLDCVEGWYFTAKWTGPALDAIFSDAGVKPDAKIAIFHTVDVPVGYSSLDLSYIHDNNIIIALKLNDITLPPERGFPFQVVAESKYGYKWAKWVTRIEISDDTNFRGYWEGYGYDNNANIPSTALEQ